MNQVLPTSLVQTTLLDLMFVLKEATKELNQNTKQNLLKTLFTFIITVGKEKESAT
jgi:hypothetical protein